MGERPGGSNLASCERDNKLGYGTTFAKSWHRRDCWSSQHSPRRAEVYTFEVRPAARRSQSETQRKHTASREGDEYQRPAEESPRERSPAQTGDCQKP